MIFIVGFNISDYRNAQLVALLRAAIQGRLDAVTVQCSFPLEDSIEPDQPVILLVSFEQSGGRAITPTAKMSLVQRVVVAVKEVLPERDVRARMIFHRLGEFAAVLN